MKKSIYFLAILMFITITLSSFKSNINDDNSDYKISISAPIFIHSLVEKWIYEYNKINPKVQIRLIKQNNTQENIDVDLFINESQEFSNKVNKDIINFSFGRFVLFPIYNSGNTLLTNELKEGIRCDKLKSIFFIDEEDLFKAERESKKKNPFKHLTVYSNSGKTNTPQLFARFYETNEDFFKGKKIIGNDYHLIKAVSYDTNAISFNHLSLIFDHKTRKPVNDIKLLPIDLNNNKKVDLEEIEAFDNLDVLLANIKSNKKINIPTNDLTIEVNKNKISIELQQFLNWIFEYGVSYNQEYGFLNSDEQIAEQINELFKTSIN
jgi:phosphate transport system substrate-binding protein